MIEFPVSTERNSLHLLLIQQQIQRGDHGFWSFAQLFRQIAFADNYISGWKSLVYIASVNGNPLSERSEFLFLLARRTFGP